MTSGNIPGGSQRNVFRFTPGRGSRGPGFDDLGPKVPIRYYYLSYGAQFLCWRLSFGEDGKSPTY